MSAPAWHHAKNLKSSPQSPYASERNAGIGSKPLFAESVHVSAKSARFPSAVPAWIIC